MKLVSNRINLGLAAIAASTSIFATTGVIAYASPTPKETLFCTNLPADISKINANINNLTGKLSTAQSNRLKNLNSNWAKVDQTLADDRTKWASDRQTQFTKLESKATTAAEKAAVSAFETTITAAIKARESANDAAIASYRSAVSSLVSNKQSSTNGQVTAFVNAVGATEAAATAACQANPSDTSIRTTFQSALRSARLTYISNRSGDSSISAQIKALAATRDAAIKANNAAFRAAQTAAEKALKAAFST